MASLIEPLSIQIPIVEPKTGCPTPQFQRLLQLLSLSAELTVTNGRIGIADGGISTEMLADGAVTTPKILDDAVTNAKLSEMAAHLVKARKTNSTGNPEDVTISDILDFIASTQGDILYRGSSGWVALAPGTSGQYLKTQGAAADPVWSTVTPVISAGSIGPTEIASTAVTPASYGDATHVGQFTVDQDGRLTAAANVLITLPSTGLAIANNLSDLASAATARTNLGLLRLIAFFFTTTPTASEVLCLYVAADAFTLPANLSGSKVDVGTNPTSTFALDIQKNGATIATISISTGGVATLTTVSGTSKAIAAGDVIKVVAPGTADATAGNIAVTLKGTL